MRHIYIHVPFCARRCVYCDFAIAVRNEIPAERYVAAVVGERDYRVENDRWDEEPLETLYFGGGTPSLLPADYLADLARRLINAETSSDPTQTLEVTLEANPDDVTPAAATVWANAGINRVSLGVQSFDPRVLYWMHRTHTSDASQRAVSVLRRAGIASISLDLIFALPDELESDVSAELRRAVALEPDHLSIYGLTVEPRTALARWVARGTTRLVSVERYAEEFLLADQVLTRVGFEHYEVSNYARPGHRARHNTAYWSGRSYAGLGPSAHSYQNGARWWNVDQWAAYEHVLLESGDPTAGHERLSGSERQLERVYLGLRTAEGVATEVIDPWPSQAAEAARAEGWLIQQGQMIRLTPPGWLELDALVTSLTTSAHSG